MKKLFCCVMALFFVVFSISMSPAQAEEAPSLEVMLSELLERHDQIVAAKASVGSSEQRVGSARAAWLPSLSMTLTRGKEQIDNRNGSSDDTNMWMHQYSFSASQLIYDFGKVSAAIQTARLRHDAALIMLESARQNLLLEAVSAWFGVLEARKQLDYAVEYEANMKQLTGMEETRVARGSGFSTDILQSKSKLAGAVASRVAREGRLISADNRFRKVFDQDPPSRERWSGDDAIDDAIALPQGFPETLEEAVQRALARNFQLVLAGNSVKTARETIRSSRATLFGGDLKLKADAKNKRNFAGTAGDKEERSMTLELSYPLFSGLGDLAGYRASSQDLIAAERRLSDTRRAVEEQARNAWQNLITARLTSDHLHNQANISSEFLELAEKERALGTRSLIDILAAKNDYITAIGGALSADLQKRVAVYALLQSMGELELTRIVQQRP